MNWGNKLLLTFVIFASGMSYLVYRSMHVNFELVEKDYYKSELRYQDVIDGTNLANKLDSTVSLQQNDNGVLLKLSQEMKNKIITGNIWFYCAYDEKKDKKFQLDVASDGTQQFQPAIILPGSYTVKVSWTSDGKNYFAEKKLMVL